MPEMSFEYDTQTFSVVKIKKKTFMQKTNKQKKKCFTQINSVSGVPPKLQVW